MKRLRVYADTSVFGGCLDAEFAEASRAFFMEVAAGRFLLVISDETVRELAQAPLAVRRVLEEVSPDDVEFVPDSDEIRQLRDAYLHAGVVGPACTEAAEHIAAASVAEVDPARISHQQPTAARDRAASPALRSVGVLDVLFKYASGRRPSRALYLRPSHRASLRPW